MLQKIAAYKHRQLWRAHAALLSGFGLMVLDVMVYLAWIPSVPAKP